MSALRPGQWYIGKAPDDGTPVAGVRMKNRRITLWKEPFGYTARFERPRQDGDEDNPPHMHTYTRVTTSYISLSHEAMENLVALYAALNDDTIPMPNLKR